LLSFETLEACPLLLQEVVARTFLRENFYNMVIQGNFVDILNRKIYPAKIIVENGRIAPSIPQGEKVYAQPSLSEEICTNNENFKKWS